ncbi:MAG: FKBP-type peptidyl-prolyl cis-trans isomerase [Bacteroidota bacterium]
MDKFSYSVGVMVGQNLLNQGLTRVFAPDVAKGIADVISGNTLQIAPEEANKILQDGVKSQAEEMYASVIARNRDFLKKNGQKDGVVTLDSGLQYQVLKEGSGATPVAADKVTTHYEGTLIDGTIFDSSIKRGQPATFPVTGVIGGWTEALQLMKVGAKWRLFIPHELAYGSQGAGKVIKPFSTLIFDIELLDITA